MKTDTLVDGPPRDFQMRHRRPGAFPGSIAPVAHKTPRKMSSMT